MRLTDAEQLGLIILGTVLASVGLAVGVYVYENRKSRKNPARSKPKDPTLENLEKWGRKLGIEFDPNDPKDPLAAIIAAGEYFRSPGCEPGGPHHQETFQRVLHMVEDMVPPDRLPFWTDQVYRLYGTGSFRRTQRHGEAG